MTRRTIVWCVLLSALPLAAAPGQAKDSTRKDTTAIRLRTIRVVGESRSTVPVTTVGGSSAVDAKLDSMPLPAAPRLEEILREIPALHVRTNSRGEAELSVRGSDARQVAVLVDGIPMTLAWDSRMDASVIPATAPQEMRFIRGLSSMLYGPNVLGGIVEVGIGRSFVQPETHSLQLTTGVDHVGGYGASATVALPIRRGGGDWLIRAGAGYRDTPGQPLARGVSEPVPVTDDLRLNTDASNVDGFLSLRYHALNGAWFSFSGSSFRAERGIAAELGVDDARFWRYPRVSRTIAVASAGTAMGKSPFGGLGDVEASIGVDVGRTDIDSYTSRTYAELDGFENGRGRTVTLRLLADQSVASSGELRTAFTFSDIRHDELLPGATSEYGQRLMSAGLENNWGLMRDADGTQTLRLSLGGAYDIGSTPRSGGRTPLGTIGEWGARIGMTAVLGKGSTLLHGGVSRRGRFPALRELYSGSLDRFAPNPELRPEKLIAVEGGMTTRVRNGELQAVVFHHHMKDAVVRTTLPDGRFFRLNRNKLVSTGVEFLVSQTVGPLALTGDLTLQSVDLTDTEAQITNRPENLPEVFGTLRARAPLVLGLQVGAVANYMGSQFCIDPGTGTDRELTAGTQFGADLSRIFWLRSQGAAWMSRLEARVSVDNVGDGARYDQCGLPQPGRLLRVQMRLF